MSLTEELAFVRQTLPGFSVDHLERTLTCRLNGQGFESWEGIAGFSPTALLLASAPGVFSSGMALSIPLTDVRQLVVTPDRIEVFLVSTHDERAVQISASGATRQEDWVDFSLVGLLRTSGFPRRGEPLPPSPFIPPGVEAAGGLAEKLEELIGMFPRHPVLGLWQAAALVAAERSCRARERLEALEGLSEKDYPAFSRLYAIAAFLSGKFRLARAILKNPHPQPDDRGLLRLSILVRATLDGLPGEPRQALRGVGQGFPYLRSYQAQQFFQIDSFASLFQTCWGSAGWLLEAWSALGAGDLREAEELLGRYRQAAPPPPLEILRLEAALRQAHGETELAYSMLRAAQTVELAHPLLSLALQLGRTDVPFPPPTVDQLPMMATDLLALWIELLLNRGEIGSAGELLERSTFRREALPVALQAWFRVLEAETRLASGKPREAEPAVAWVLALAGLNGGGDPEAGRAEPFEEFLLHPTFPDLIRRACVADAALRLDAGDPVGARRRLGWAPPAGDSTTPNFGTGHWQKAGGPLPRVVDAARIMSAADGALAAFDQVGGPLAVGAASLPPLERWRKLGISLHRRVQRLFSAIVPRPTDELWPRLFTLPECLSRPLLVAVMGEFNSGKSTFLNALLEGPYLPTGVRPTTRLPCIVRWGPGPLLQATDSEKRRTVHPLESSLSLVDEQASGPAHQEVVQLEVHLPLPILQEVWFVDMPGLNSRYSRHQAASEEFLHEADAIFWISNATQVGRASELGAMARLIRPSQQLTLFLNRMDEIPAEERQELVEAFLESAREHTPAGQTPQVIPLSARQAMSEPHVRDSWMAWIDPFFAGAKDRKVSAIRARLRDLQTSFTEYSRRLRDDWGARINDLEKIAGTLEPRIAEQSAVIPSPAGGPTGAQVGESFGASAPSMMGMGGAGGGHPPQSFPRPNGTPPMDLALEAGLEAAIRACRAFWESGDGVLPHLRAQTRSGLEEAADTLLPLLAKATLREAESLFFPCLEGWKALQTRFPHPTPARWLTAFRSRLRSLEKALPDLLARTFWEIAMVQIALERNGGSAAAVGTQILGELQRAAGAWLAEFRGHLHLANGCLLAWARSERDSLFTGFFKPCTDLFEEMERI